MRLKVRKDGYKICFKLYLCGYRVVNRVVDLVFLADIVVQLNTCFQDKMGNRVFSRWRIFKHYVQTWMLLDLASILPLDTIVGLGCTRWPTA